MSCVEFVVHLISMMKYELRFGKNGYPKVLYLGEKKDSDHLVGCFVITPLYLFFRGLEFMLEFLSEMVQVYRSSTNKKKLTV